MSDVAPSSETPLATFLSLRAALIATRPFPGGSGPEICAALTTALDEALSALARPVTDNRQRLAVVAVGGYGRGELCLYSDIDVLLLHDGRVPDGATDAVLYPLWDARLKVGHAVRTVKQSLIAAAERTETATALLDARPVAGDVTLVDDLRAGLGRMLRAGRLHLAGPLVAAERERRTREPYQLLEANVKDGRGGLRALHGLHWMRRARALAGIAPAGAAPDDEAAGAHRALLSARNALHAAAGRAYDLYAFDLRGPAAVWQGLSEDEASRRLYRAMRAADRQAAAFWGLAPNGVGDVDGAPDGQATPPRGRLARLRRPGRRAPAPPSAPPPSEHVSPLVAAAQAVTTGLPFDAVSLAAVPVRSAPPPIWDESDRRALLALLAAGQAGWEAFDALETRGRLQQALPEWTHAVAAPQYAPFHLHPLDVHLWRTVIEMQTIVRPDSDEPWCAEVAADLETLDDALLAALLHDLGKGMAGDHAATGADMVAAFCRRARFGPVVTGTVVRAVRHHLLLPNVATRRDIDDPRVVAGVAAQAGDLRTLRILYLLAVADSRATGPVVWTPWKASLVRTLFARAVDHLTRHGPVPLHTPQEDAAARALTAAATGRFDAALVREHIDAMPQGYLTAFPVPDLLRHLEAVSPPPLPGAVTVDVVPGAEAAEVLVVTDDRPGLLAAISGVFALHNVSVLQGRFFTRADGVALDTFHVVDALGGATDALRWERVRADLPRALHGDLPLEELLTEKARAYRRGGLNGNQGTGSVEVVVDPEASERFTVVEVHCPDRTGLLHQITRALFDLDLDIHLAKIDTRGREVTDTFYVRDLDGEPVTDAGRRDAIRIGLTRRLTEDVPG